MKDYKISQQITESQMLVILLAYQVFVLRLNGALFGIRNKMRITYVFLNVSTVTAYVRACVHLFAMCYSFCSCGTKRKVGIAVALIGQPSIVFLDNATAGLDPVSRRHVWEVLITYRKAGGTIVITSQV